MLFEPSSPIVLPFRSATLWMPSSVLAMIELSARGTSAATATTGVSFCWAKNISGSYEMPTSARPAATSLIGSLTSDGSSVCTVRPRAANIPLSIAENRPTWSGFGYQSSATVRFVGGAVVPGGAEPELLESPQPAAITPATRARTMRGVLNMACIPSLA